MWTRDYIESLKEESLCREVLVPLFRAMGYRDVRYTGGGILEQGKDIVMWKPNPPRDRVDYAVVVKAEKISGKTITGTVVTQVKECFGRPYEDTATYEPRHVGHCFVVSSHPISKEGTYTLGSLLSHDNLETSVTTVDGDRLWHLVGRYLPARRAVTALADAYKVLAPKDPTVSFEVNVGPEGALFIIEPISGTSMSISGSPTFPDTEDGRKAKSEFEEFLKTGRPVELSGEFLVGLKFPKAVAELLDSLGPPARVRLGRRPSEPFEFELEVEGSGGVFRLPHISFSTVEAGTDSVTLRNDEQALPFRLSLIINRDLQATLNYQFQFQGESVEWLQRHLELAAAVGPGSVMRLRSHRTFESFEAKFSERAEPQQVQPSYKALVAELLAIQRKTGQLIRVPDRPFFTPADLEGIDRVVRILATGREETKGEITAGFHLSSDDPEAAAKILKGGVDLRVEKSTWVERVLDENVDLGPVCVVARNLHIHPDEVERVTSELGSGAKDISCRWLFGDKRAVEVTFSRWLAEPTDSG